MAMEHPDRAESARADALDLPPRVVFFDGVCGFCDGTVAWLFRTDARKRLWYAPLQGEAAAAIRARHPGLLPDDVDTVVFLEAADDGGPPHVKLRSDAILAVVDELPGPVRFWRIARIVPRRLRDFLYEAFAARRYRWFGKLDACRIPSPEERARFLD